MEYEFGNNRTRHSMSRLELVQGFANRVYYSKYYSILYIITSCLCLITLILSIFETACSSILFFTFEIIINLIFILEVIFQFIILKKNFWKSRWNVIDLVLLILSLITLSLLLTHCSINLSSEFIFELCILIIRNLFQFIRLFILLKKNQRQLSVQNNTIDFTGLSTNRRGGVNNNNQGYDIELGGTSNQLLNDSAPMGEYSLNQLTTSEGFVLEDDEDEELQTLTNK